MECSALHTAMEGYLKEGAMCHRAPRVSEQYMRGTPHGDGRLA